MWSMIMSFAGGLVKPITEYVKGRQAIKKADLDSKLKINEAKTNAQIEKIQTGQNADIAWENTSLAQSGWKDEFWTIIIAAP